MKARPRRRPVLSSPEAIGGVIDRAGRGTGSGASDRPSFGFAAKPSISMRDWQLAVGARIAERAQPIELDRGTLVVRVATSVWASELSLLAEPILARLHARGFAVRALRYRVGAVEAAVRPKAMRATRAIPAPLPLPRNLEEALVGVDDEELRVAIGDAARANLAWQAYVACSPDPHGQHTPPTISELDPPAAFPAARATPTPATIVASRAVRVPQSSEREIGRPDQTSGAGSEGPRRRP